MADFVTVIRLIALNAHDFVRVSKKYLSSLGVSSKVRGDDENGNHLQAKMLGWAFLLNIWTRELLDHYNGKITYNEEFRNSVEKCWKAYIIEGLPNE